MYPPDKADKKAPVSNFGYTRKFATSALALYHKTQIKGSGKEGQGKLIQPERLSL